MALAIRDGSIDVKGLIGKEMLEKGETWWAKRYSGVIDLELVYQLNSD
jgi:hypothetical protein